MDSMLGVFWALALVANAVIMVKSVAALKKCFMVFLVLL